MQLLCATTFGSASGMALPVPTRNAVAGSALRSAHPPYLFDADVRSRDFYGQALQGV